MRPRALANFARKLQVEVARGRAFDCLITGDAEMRRLNREFRGKDYATDVLSFPSGNGQATRPAPLGDIAISAARARAQAREFGHTTEQEIRILMLHGVLHLLGMDHETDGGRMARAEKRWRQAPGPSGRPDRTGGRMIFAVAIAILIAIPLLGLVTLVQLALPGEPAAAHPRPALAEVLQGHAGRPHRPRAPKQGADSFSLIKHTLLVLLGVLFLAWLADGQVWTAPVFWKSVLAAWLTMFAVTYALPQFLYRRTSGRWLLPLVPLLRALAWIARPCDALLEFFRA